EGSAQHVREQLEAWRGRRRGAGSGATGARSSLPITAEGINVRWLGAEPGERAEGDNDAPPDGIQGIRFERSGERARASFESARFESKSLAITLTDASAEFVSGPEGLMLESARLAQLLGRVNLGGSKNVPAGAGAAAAPEVELV